METQTSIEPIVKTLTLKASCEKAFRHFTDHIHLWWPLAGHSLSQADAETVKFEARKDGRIYEIEKSGREREWGRVGVCDAPHRLVFSWVLEKPADATEVEVRFEEEGDDACTMTLIHRGWDERSDGRKWRENYHTGWDGVLGAYAEALN